VPSWVGERNFVGEFVSAVVGELVGAVPAGTETGELPVLAGTEDAELSEGFGALEGLEFF